MNTLSYYSGYDQYRLVKRLEVRAVNLDPAQTIHLKDTAIQINTLTKSVSYSKTALEHATAELNPVLSALCSLIQKVVFWCLGIDALELSINQKNAAIDAALQAASAPDSTEELLKISPAAEFFWKGEFIPVTIEPQEANGFILYDQFQLRIRGRVVAVLREIEEKSGTPKTLRAIMQSKKRDWIEPLIQIAMELVQREVEIERLEILADDSYDLTLQQLQFSVQHQPDLARASSSMKKTPIPANVLKSELAKEEQRKKEEALKKAADAPPQPALIDDGGKAADKPDRIDVVDRVDDDTELEREPAIWWMDKARLHTLPGQDLPHLPGPGYDDDHPLVKKPDYPLVFGDMPTLNQLRHSVPV